MRGHLLLAAPSLEDPNFHQSVVLLFAHNEAGATGVILNAPLEVTVGQALGDAIESAGTVQEPLYRGGPCGTPVLVLHGNESIPGETILPGVRLSADREAIEQLMSEGNTAGARFFLGFSGWGSEQLENELAEGSWLTLPATAAEAFGETDDLWQRLSVRATLGRFVKPGDIPQDPNLN